MFPNISILKYFILHIQNLKPTQLSRPFFTFLLFSKSVLTQNNIYKDELSNLEKSLKAKSNTWLQFNLKLADRIIFSKELHLSVESIEAECSLQTCEGSSYPRKYLVSCGKIISKTQSVQDWHRDKVNAAANAKDRTVRQKHSNVMAEKLQCRTSL